MAKTKHEENKALWRKFRDSEVEKIMKEDSRGMTEGRIGLLEAEDFVWNAWDHAWHLKYVTSGHTKGARIGGTVLIAYVLTLLIIVNANHNKILLAN
jgi:hypothetical protein